MQTPAVIRMRMRAARPLRSSPTRPPSQKINGVSAAQIHDSMKERMIGAVGDMPRKPNPRGSSQRLTAERNARNVQKAKIATTSRAERRRMIARLSPLARQPVQLVTAACTSCRNEKRIRRPFVFLGVQSMTNGEKTMRKTITAVAAVLTLAGTMAFADAPKGEHGFGGRHHRHGMFGEKL